MKKYLTPHTLMLIALAAYRLQVLKDRRALRTRAARTASGSD